MKDFYLLEKKSKQRLFFTLKVTMLKKNIDFSGFII